MTCSEPSLHSVSTRDDRKQHEKQEVHRIQSAGAWPQPANEPELYEHPWPAPKQDGTFDPDGGQFPLSTGKTIDARPNPLSRTLSSRSGVASFRDPGPPPDGGRHAWAQVVAVHLSIFSTWGLISGFGVFQVR